MPPKYGILAALLTAAVLCRAQAPGSEGLLFDTSFCGASAASITYTDSMSCCFSLHFQYDPADGFYNGIELGIVQAEPSFSTVQFPLSDGWLYTSPEPSRRLRWTRPSGPLPPGERRLADFCIDNWNSSEPVRLAVNWLNNGQLQCSDTLELYCSNCLQVIPDTVVCRDDSTYLYTFNIQNRTGFTVNSLRIREAPGNDYIVEQSVLLPVALAPGETLNGLSLTLRPSAASLADMCFELTPSRTAANGLNLDCCTVVHCVAIPDCERCCTDYEDFEADVAAGFRTEIDCNEGRLTAWSENLNVCDRVLWTVRNVNATATLGAVLGGHEAFNYFFPFNGAYLICMEVTRNNADGMACYASGSTLKLCDTVLVDCICFDSLNLNLEFPCALGQPANIELNVVCGCDSMTYINACAAMNWAGLDFWTPGACPPMLIDVIELMVSYAAPNGLLNWNSQAVQMGQTDFYRSFIVQRRINGGPWATLAVVGNTTFNYIDVPPPSGQHEYRIVGVTWQGKVVFSNIGMILVSTGEPGMGMAMRIWPNPASTAVFLEIPDRASFRLQIYAADGRLVKTQRIEPAELTVQVDVSEWPPGLYFFQIQRHDGPQRITKILIMR
ncbi:MAG: T9SS type A sorting domain-containing protein [Saprospiraceae bacterium]|nr:T9SS type A sorting domain-containing protein [Saprospiraceae bacterium]